jgi:glutamate decarboxylase
MPPALDDVSVLRIVVRNGFHRDLATLFIDDLGQAVERLQHGRAAPVDRVGFHH